MKHIHPGLPLPGNYIRSVGVGKLISVRARSILRWPVREKVYHVPTNDGSNTVLAQWIGNAKIMKEIAWSCARLSFSILLQDKRVDLATVAYLMGHATTEHVYKTYKRHRPIDQTSSVA